VANTDSAVIVADWVIQRITDHQADLGLQDVWRGDQSKLPRTPCVVVDSGPKTRVIQGAPRMSKNELTLFITVYYGVVRDTQLNVRDADVLGESVELLLHEDPTLGKDPNQLAYHSLVTAVEPGLANKGGTLYRGTRLTFVVYTKTMLPKNLGT
jgi:hypothetical protein